MILEERFTPKIEDRNGTAQTVSDFLFETWSDCTYMSAN